MQSELKPCPFCGSDKHMLLSPTCDRSTPYNPADRAFPIIRCGGCYTDVPGKDFDASGKSAVEAWNRRSALVDVLAVEPVGEAVASKRMPGFTLATFEESEVPAGTKLFTSPPLSREGEDNAETIARRVLDALRAADLGDLLRASDEVALPTIARALAATRSGSATDLKGCAE